jgi:hypothetical protein
MYSKNTHTHTHTQLFSRMPPPACPLHEAPIDLWKYDVLSAARDYPIGMDLGNGYRVCRPPMMAKALSKPKYMPILTPTPSHRNLLTPPCKASAHIHTACHTHSTHTHTMTLTLDRIHLHVYDQAHANAVT